MLGSVVFNEVRDPLKSEEPLLQRWLGLWGIAQYDLNPKKWTAYTTVWP